MPQTDNFSELISRVSTIECFDAKTMTGSNVYRSGEFLIAGVTAWGWWRSLPAVATINTVFSVEVSPDGENWVDSGLVLSTETASGDTYDSPTPNPPGWAHFARVVATTTGQTSGAVSAKLTLITEVV